MSESSEISDAESTVRQNKYARLLELEEEAEELKSQLEERNEDLKGACLLLHRVVDMLCFCFLAHASFEVSI